MSDKKTGNASMDKALLKKGRAICPNCGKKGVGYAIHAHAFGYKDYDRASCRYCNSTFSKVKKSPQ
jgi:hypothetical protein